MTNNDLIKREDGEGKIYNIDPNNPEHKYSIPIIKILEQHYNYILEEMNKENFTINKKEECMMFKEIVLIDEVVGFSTYIGASAEDHNALTLQYIYVIPEYRGNNLLVKDIIDTISFDKYVSITSPTRFMVESLINGGLAGKLDDRFVISRIPFCVPLHKFTQKEKQYLKEQYNIPDPTGINRESSLYDLKYCAVVCPAFDGTNKAYNPNDDTTNSLEDGYISEIIEIDDKYFDAKKNRNDNEIYTEKYFKRVSDTIKTNNNKINDLLN